MRPEVLPQRRGQDQGAHLWPEHDSLFPAAWSDRLDVFFSDVRLEPLPGVGHFSPLEAADRFAGAIRAALSGET